MKPASPIVWIISEMFHPVEISTGHYMTNIATGLARTHEVKVISCAADSEAHPFRSHEIFEGAEVFRFRTPALRKRRFLPRLFQMAWQTMAFVWMSMVKVRRGDTVLVVTNPPSLPMVLVPLLKAKGVRTMLRVDDVYPDAMAAAGLISEQGLIFRIFMQINRFLYRNTDLIITLGRDMQETLRKGMASVQHKKVVVIPNWADLEDVSPTDRAQNDLLKSLGITDKFVFLVAGNMGRVQGIPSIIDAAERLSGHDSIRILFIGSGTLEDYLKAEILKRGLGNVLVLPNQPRTMQNVFLNACDAAVITLSEGMRGIGVPSRMYNYMAAGKPLFGIVDADSEPGLVIAEEHIGWVTRPGEPAEIATSMLNASRDPAVLAMGFRSRQVAMERFSKEAILHTYNHALESHVPVERYAK